MQDLDLELSDIIEDDIDTCSITAVNGDDEPPCIYHPTLEEFVKSQQRQEEQFQKMRDSETYAMFKRKIEKEGPWQGWDSMSIYQNDEDMSRILYTAESLTSGYDVDLDDFICFMYVLSQKKDTENEYFIDSYKNTCMDGD